MGVQTYIITMMLNYIQASIFRQLLPKINHGGTKHFSL